MRVRIKKSEPKKLLPFVWFGLQKLMRRIRIAKSANPCATDDRVPIPSAKRHAISNYPIFVVPARLSKKKSSFLPKKQKQAFRKNERRALLVLKIGLEPIRSFLRGILSPLRLPIPPLQQSCFCKQRGYYSTFLGACQTITPYFS